jgi:tetratricopeptide (TPR) repeat protein
MAGHVPIRWLAAFLLLAALPAAPQALVGTTDGNASAENEATVAGSGDIADVVRPPEQRQLPQLEPEELGDLYRVRQRYQAAIQAYQRIEHPTASVWNKIGIAYQQMFALKEAERCYKQALKLDLDNPKVLNNLATVQDQMKDFATAEKNYRRAIELNPTSALLYKNLGTNLLMQHEYEKGDEAYKKAVSLDPKIFDEHFGPKVNDPAPETERGTAAYFKARICARAGLNDCAINYLIKAFNEGSATVKKVTEEADFARLQGTPALTRLLARQQ